MGWEEAMWAELDELTEPEQIIMTGAWITHMQQVVVAQLAARRRTRVLDLLAQGWDATRIAEEIGSRRNTITRLAEEGRAALREQHRNEAA